MYDKLFRSEKPAKGRLDRLSSPRGVFGQKQNDTSRSGLYRFAFMCMGNKNVNQPKRRVFAAIRRSRTAAAADRYPAEAAVVVSAEEEPPTLMPNDPASCRKNSRIILKMFLMVWKMPPTLMTVSSFIGRALT